MKLKILHITNWYPDYWNPKKAIWIKKTIASLSEKCENKVVHVEIRKGSFSFKSGTYEDSTEFMLLWLPFEFWILNEILSFTFVLIVYFRNRGANYDLINFHVAYPNCTYIHKLTKWINKPVVISEHWSAYHYSFNIQRPEKKKKIQGIFQRGIPVIAVSKALLQDIRNFSGGDFPGYIIPNLVDTDVFNIHNTSLSRKNAYFFMVSQWKWPKDPFTVIEAWDKVCSIYPEAILKIGGYGPQEKDIKASIIQKSKSKRIIFIGSLTQEQIAAEMKQSKAFIHCSEYETFSVVCAEALCCGLPVIASKVGGIPEFVHDDNGILVSENTPEAFYSAIKEYLENEQKFDRMLISRKASDHYSNQRIGEKYYTVLSKIIAS